MSSNIFSEVLRNRILGDEEERGNESKVMRKLTTVKKYKVTCIRETLFNFLLMNTYCLPIVNVLIGTDRCNFKLLTH